MGHHRSFDEAHLITSSLFVQYIIVVVGDAVAAAVIVVQSCQNLIQMALLNFLKHTHFKAIGNYIDAIKASH